MYTIEDLRNGKCAVINDGTLEELQQVLKLAFPEDSTTLAGAFMLYIKHDDNNRYWYGIDETSLPQQSVRYFLNQINKKMRKITWQQAQELIDEAYPDFQITLAKMWANDIVLKYDIHISEEFYSQLKLHFGRDEALMVFNKIFGTECPYKDGEPIWVRDAENSLWYFRYSNGKISKIGSFETYQSQRKNGPIDIWKYAMPFDPNNLPVNK